MFTQVKDKRYAAYVLPICIKDGKKQVALIEYRPHEYGLIGGRFEDGETDARGVLRRELIEELNVGAEKIADTAIEIPTPYSFDVAPERWAVRCARSETHYMFVAFVSADTEIIFCEKCSGKPCVVWLDIESLLDEKVIGFANEREYFAQYVLPIIRKTNMNNTAIY